MTPKWFHLPVAIGALCATFAVVAERRASVENEAEAPAPGWGALGYEPPVPGTYDLPSILPAADGAVLLEDGSKASLRSHLQGKISVLSFIYTRCSDANGCPLATFVLHSLKNAIADRPDMADKVRFISLSFDPDHDTPQAMRDYGRDFKEGTAAEWLFMTTESDKELRPILKAYSQYVNKARNDAGNTDIAHTLRAYLVDASGDVRNIYSIDFLHPKLLMADIETILLDKSRLSKRDAPGNEK